MASPQRTSPAFASVLLAVGLVAYGVLLNHFIGAHASGADNSGYLNHARLLREGRIETATRALPELPAKVLSAYAYVPIGFTPAEPGDPTYMVPIYPIGLPLLIAGVSWLSGWDAAPRVTMLLHALAGVALMYGLARRAGLTRAWAALGALLLATSPMYLFGSVQAMSDMPSLVWTTLALFLVWRANASTRATVGAGVALAIAVLIRPTNVLAFLPVALALGRDARRWLALIAGGLPGAVIFLGHNHLAYGSALASGYGPIWKEFGWEHVAGTFWHYIKWGPVVLTPLALGAVGLLLRWKQAPRETRILVAWIGAFAGFYLFYPFTNDDWWYLRFVLPAFPAVILGGLVVASRITERLRIASNETTRRVAWVVTLALVMSWSVPWNYRLHTYSIGRNEHAYVEAADWARRHIPANAIVFAMQTTGALYYYTDLSFIHWQLVSAKDIAAIEAAAAKRGRPVFAMLFPFEQQPFLNHVYPGPWQRIGQVRHISVWQRL